MWQAEISLLALPLANFLVGREEINDSSAAKYCSLLNPTNYTGYGGVKLFQVTAASHVDHEKMESWFSLSMHACGQRAKKTIQGQPEGLPERL